MQGITGSLKRVNVSVTEDVPQDDQVAETSHGLQLFCHGVGLLPPQRSPQHHDRQGVLHKGCLPSHELAQRCHGEDCHTLQGQCPTA